MEAKTAELKDAAGKSIGNCLVFDDGTPVPSFGKSPQDQLNHLRALTAMPLRHDDVMLFTHGKAGTHWSFEILAMLLKGKAEREPTEKVQLMIEAVTVADLDRMTSPRILNTHGPMATFPAQLREGRNKVLVTMRNPKDVAVSLYYHAMADKLFSYDGTFGDFLQRFMDEQLPYGGWFEHTLAVEKALDSGEYDMHVAYYEDLKENGIEEIKKIAKFLGVDASDELVEAIHDECSFKKMAAEKGAPKMPLEDGGKTGFKEGFSIYRKGIIGDWKNHFTVAQNEAFDKLYAEKMASSKFKFRFVGKENN